MDITKELTVSDLIAWAVPETGGPFVTGDPQSNELSGEVLLRPLATIAADSLSDPMTPANLLLFKEVSEGGTAAAQYDETSVAEYKVQWGGSAGGSNASSSSPFYAPDDTITLDHDGDYTFDVLPYQKTFSQENGTATGGIFYLKTSTGSTIESLTFPWKKRDSNYINFPYEGGRQTIFRANMTAGTYRLGFTSHAGSGSGNRVSYEGYAHVIVRRTSLLSAAGPSEPIDWYIPNGTHEVPGEFFDGKQIYRKTYQQSSFTDGRVIMTTGTFDTFFENRTLGWVISQSDGQKQSPNSDYRNYRYRVQQDNSRQVVFNSYLVSTGASAPISQAGRITVFFTKP